jgi:hypothetical protein
MATRQQDERSVRRARSIRQAPSAIDLLEKTETYANLQYAERGRKDLQISGWSREAAAFASPRAASAGF